jgi:hypothetical protein
MFGTKMVGCEWLGRTVHRERYRAVRFSSYPEDALDESTARFNCHALVWRHFDDIAVNISSQSNRLWWFS